MGTNYFINPPLGWRGLGNKFDKTEFPDNPVYNVGDLVPIHFITNFTSSTTFLFQDFAATRRIGERVFGPVKPEIDGHQRFNWTVNTGRFNIKDSNVFFLVVSSPDQDLIYSHYFNLTNRGQAGASPAVAPAGLMPETTTLPIPEPVGGNLNLQPQSGLKLPVVLGLVGGVLVGLTLLLLGGYYLLRYYRTRTQSGTQDYMETRRKSRMMERGQDVEDAPRAPDAAIQPGMAITSNKVEGFHFDFDQGAPLPDPPKASRAQQPEREMRQGNGQEYAGFRVFTKASGQVKELTDSPSEK